MRHSLYRWISILFPILLLWGSVAHADCASGNILIGISKGAFKKFFDVTFLTYCVRFPNGDVSLFTTEDIPRHNDHADLMSLPFYKEWNKYDKRTAMFNENRWLVGLLKYETSYPSFRFNFSSNGNYVAFCRDKGKKSLSVYEVSTRREITTIITAKPIEATAWSPDGNHIAVLTTTSRPCLWPLELLLAFVGHPIPVTTFYLNVYDLTGKGILTDKLIDKNVKGGSASVLWLKERFPPGIPSGDRK